MPYIVLAVWIIQAAVGVSLLVSWARHGRRTPITVVVHVGSAIAGLVLWVAFLATGAILPAWLAFAAITLGNVFGDTMLVRRHRRAGRRECDVRIGNRRGLSWNAAAACEIPRRLRWCRLLHLPRSMYWGDGRGGPRVGRGFSICLHAAGEPGQLGAPQWPPGVA